MAGPDPDLPMNGADAKLVLFYGGARVPGVDGYITKWSIKEVATKFRDALIGRSRKRTDKKVDGYDGDCEVQIADLSLVKFLKSIDDAREAKNGTLKELAIGIDFNERLGGVEGVMVSKCTATFEITSGGQSERITGKLTLEGEEFSSMTLQ